MADDPLPTVDVGATAADFPGIAQSTGIKLKEELSNANLTSNDSDLAWSEISQHQESLGPIMKEFRKYVSVFKRCPNGAICSLYILSGIQETTSSRRAPLEQAISHNPSKVIS